MEQNNKSGGGQATTKLAETRTDYASKRTSLANTRTLLSYIRTCLIFLSVSIAFYKIEKRIDWINITFFCLAGAVLLIGIIHFLCTSIYIKLSQVSAQSN